MQITRPTRLFLPPSFVYNLPIVLCPYQTWPGGTTCSTRPRDHLLVWHSMFSQGSYDSHRSVTNLTRRKSESLQGGRFGLQWWMAQKDGTQGREVPAEHHGQRFFPACRTQLPSLLRPRVCTMLYRDRAHTIRRFKPLLLLSPAPNATRLWEFENKSRQLFPSL